MELQLSKKQVKRIKYECDLLKMSPQQLYVVAPHLFVENITSANTEAKDVIEELKEQASNYLESLKSNDDYEYGGLY